MIEKQRLLENREKEEKNNDFRLSRLTVDLENDQRHCELMEFQSKFSTNQLFNNNTNNNNITQQHLSYSQQFTYNPDDDSYF